MLVSYKVVARLIAAGYGLEFTTACLYLVTIVSNNITLLHLIIFLSLISSKERSDLGMDYFFFSSYNVFIVVTTICPSS